MHTMTDDYRLAFLLANWYSGATVLNILLNDHPRIVSNGEAFPFNPADAKEYACSCGHVLHECAFYRAAGEHMLAPDGQSWNRELFAQLPRYSGVPLLNRWLLSYRHASRLRDLALVHVPAYRRTHDAFMGAHDRFFSNAVRAQGAVLYLDGTKSYRRAEIFAPRADAVLHIVRDGRGFCNSFRKNQAIEADNLENIARQWVEHIRALEQFRVRHPGLRVITVRYEDLCRDLEGTLRAACNALGVPFDRRVLGGQLGEYHLLGNRMRMGFDGVVREDLSWQTELTARQVRLITAVMGSELERYGYT